MLKCVEMTNILPLSLETFIEAIESRIENGKAVLWDGISDPLDHPNPSLSNEIIFWVKEFDILMIFVR